MRMMYIDKTWYHILSEVETPFYHEENFKQKLDYIILQDNLPKLLRSHVYTFKERIITHQKLNEMIIKIESETWRSEEKRITYLNYFRKVSQILRDFVIDGVLKEESKYSSEELILLAC